jgi:hypothetical protein
MNIKRKFVIGFIPCLITIILISLFLPKLLILNLIPLFLFAFSLFIKNRFLSFMINSLILIVFVYLFISFRLETSEKIVFESRVRYQIVDIVLDDLVRISFEEALSNRSILLADTIYGIKIVYVNTYIYKKLCPEVPFRMRKKKYTIKAKFELKKLFFGGYSIAKVSDYRQLSEEPIVTK